MKWFDPLASEPVSLEGAKSSCTWLVKEQRDGVI